MILLVLDKLLFHGCERLKLFPLTPTPTPPLFPLLLAPQILHSENGKISPEQVCMQTSHVAVDGGVLGGGSPGGSGVTDPAADVVNSVLIPTPRCKQQRP